MPRTLRKGVAEMGHQPGEAVASPQRVSLADRLERARERGGREARRGLPGEERERIRREAFGASPLLRGHADELLAITGELARVLPSHAEYQARTNGDWGTGATGPSSRSRIENPACTFGWEIKHNPQGMLNQCPVREYNWALENTSRVCDLWEGEPTASEAELAKALIVQTVLGDDELRAVVLERASTLVRTAAGTLGPYFAEWKH